MLIALFDIVDFLLAILVWIIIGQVILSWLFAFNVLNTSSQGLRTFVNALDRITAPLYRPIRKMMPDFGGIDFSPLVAARPDPDPPNASRRGRTQPHLSERMTARRIDGKAAAAALRERVASAVADFERQTGRAPGLATVLVGEDPASAVYVRSKGKATAEAGMASFSHNLPDNISQARAARPGRRAQRAIERVDGILVQLPLPRQIDDKLIIAAIDPAKDVDGFHALNAGRLATGLDALVPCTPLGCLHLLKAELGSLEGKDAVVIGRSNIVGKPMAMLLLGESATVTIAHSKTRDLADVVRRADIVIAAVGRAEMVRGDWIKPGAVVIDVGINRIPAADGKVAAGRRCRVRRSSRSGSRDHARPRRSWADDDRHATQEHTGRRAPPRRPRRSGRVLRC